MSTDTSQISLAFDKQLVLEFLSAIDNATKQGYRMIWSAMKVFLVEHWLLVIISLVCIFLIALLDYKFTRRWRMLGSVMYNYFYFGILFLVALIFGSDVFASNYFKIFLAILYVVCFTAVGILLKKTGVRKTSKNYPH